MKYKHNRKNFSKRQKFNILEGELRTERTTFRNNWRDLSEFILPRRGRFFVTDVNEGERKNTSIIDSTGTMASRTLASGMMTGVTSPARPWFKMETDDKELNKAAAVRSYFSDVEDNMRNIFLKSNLYNILPTLYGDMGTFATGCIFMEKDEEDVVRFTSFPVGSYMLSNDKKGRARVFFREFQMSVRQIVEKFGIIDPNKPELVDFKNITRVVQDHYENDQLEIMIDINHLVLSNEDYDPRRPESKYKKFKSVYYERGLSQTSTHAGFANNNAEDKFLSEKGYDFFPALAVRWEVEGEDTYGTNSPGMICIGDVKQLQLGERRIAEAIDQKVKPSMTGPTALKNAKASILPGDITYLDERDGVKGFRRLFEIDFDIRELEQKQDQIRQRISKAYYEDLFLMLANTNRRQITATEVEERHEEKLLALGPVLERINQDLLDPLIENTYAIMEEEGLLPETPEELEGLDYNIEYISIMAQAQKLAGIGNIERLFGFVGQVAALDPIMARKVNVEEAIEKYGDLVGVPPNLIVSKEEMEAFRQQQAEAEQAEQQAAQQAQMVEAGKSLSETKMGDDTALDALIGG